MTTEELEKIATCARRLVRKLKVIYAHPSYQSVWFCAQNHIGPYKGPNYEREFKALTEALKKAKSLKDL